MAKTKVLVIVQARMDSARLPGKVMRLIDGKPSLQVLHERLSFSKETSKIIIATTKRKIDNKIVNLCLKKNYLYFRGSVDNILNRYFNASKKYNPDYVVRVTGDCPLIDAKIIDKLIQLIKKTKSDYACNVFPPTFPDGYDIDVVTLIC